MVSFGTLNLGVGRRDPLIQWERTKDAEKNREKRQEGGRGWTKTTHNAPSITAHPSDDTEAQIRKSKIGL
ncbi:hypothetical protein TNCV_3832251 [Trichonephila clavipes]|nr:hypothetical protein TNCV_3832251 [Trichonephila clavipes]